jgi:5'-methylthioadenosine phosphorylase
LAILGHQKDYQILSGLAAWKRGKTIRTPFGGPVQVYEGVFRPADVDFFFIPRYGTIAGVGRSYNPRALVFAAARCGIDSVLSLNGVGAIHRAFKIGDIVLIHDFIDFTRRRDSSFLDNACPEGFVRMNPPFCPAMREVIKSCSRKLSFKLGYRGVYACIDGPRFETPAEVSFLALAGSDVLGMRVASEAVLFREMEICYCSVCFVLDYAEGKVKYIKTPSISGLRPQAMPATINARIESILRSSIPLLAKRTRQCVCADALLDLRKKGVLNGSAVNYIRGLH